LVEPRRRTTLAIEKSVVCKRKSEVSQTLEHEKVKNDGAPSRIFKVLASAITSHTYGGKPQDQVLDRKLQVDFPPV
jgi:hypothetical protein